MQEESTEAEKMKYFVKKSLYRLGRRLMHLNYVAGSNAVEHDLRLEVARLREELAAIKLKHDIDGVLAVAKIKEI